MARRLALPFLHKNGPVVLREGSSKGRMTAD